MSLTLLLEKKAYFRIKAHSNTGGGQEHWHECVNVSVWSVLTTEFLSVYITITASRGAEGQRGKVRSKESGKKRKKKRCIRDKERFLACSLTNSNKYSKLPHTNTKERVRVWQAGSDPTGSWQESESVQRHHSCSLHRMGSHLAANSSLLWNETLPGWMMERVRNSADRKDRLKEGKHDDGWTKDQRRKAEQLHVRLNYMRTGLENRKYWLHIQALLIDRVFLNETTKLSFPSFPRIPEFTVSKILIRSQ